MTPDQAKTKFNDMLEEIFDTVNSAGLLCMPNESGFEIEGADIEDNSKINIYRAFTSFWLLTMIKRHGVATENDINERVLLCLSIIGMNGSKKTDKLAMTLFE